MLNLRAFALVAVAGLAVTAQPSHAQTTSGGIEVRMTRSSGKALNGRISLSPSLAGSSKARSFARWAGVAAGDYRVRCSHPGYKTITKKVSVLPGSTIKVNCQMTAVRRPKEEAKPRPKLKRADMAAGTSQPSMRRRFARRPTGPRPMVVARAPAPDPDFNTENYKHIEENPYQSPTTKPLSTFSIDVDTASYSNVRRFLNQGQRPPADAVKIEELINYFSYDDAVPKGETPFGVTTEVSTAPWNDAHQLVRIGLRGKDVATDKMPASNLVFLLDVSGSMNNANKLPLLKSAFSLLVNNLRPRDRVAIVVYAGAAGMVLPSTSGARKSRILAAIDSLSAGGSTAGGAGIELAYRIAKDNFIKGGNNRVILATDGDFNVGVSSEGSLTRLIEKKRKSGVFLTVLGFGSGNYQDAKMEQLADKGNGNHAYIDNILEAKKVLVTEMGGTLLTIAKDVKIQVEFNPKQVKAYRLIGYENRKLAARDFNDDKKDAGELGAGHSITALYEVVPAGSKEKLAGIDELKYQRSASTAAGSSNELMTVKLRYKPTHGDKSKLLTRVVNNNPTAFGQASNNLRFSAAVAEFGMLLRDSKLKGNSSYAKVIKLAKAASGQDKGGYRAEFIELVKKAAKL